MENAENTLHSNQVFQHVAQGVSDGCKLLQALRMEELRQTLDQILTGEKLDIAIVQGNFQEASKCLTQSLTEIDKHIRTNRGGPTGLHGFIFEEAECGVTNARRVMQGMKRCVKVLNDNGPADLKVFGRDVQCKCYNDLMREVKAGADYMNMKMMYPNGHVRAIEQIMRGDKYVDFDGKPLTINEITKIRDQINAISEQRGEPWNKWIKASNVEYKEVQKEEIHHTIRKERHNLKREASRQESEIHKKADQKRTVAHKQAKPSCSQASKAAGSAAVLQGGISFGEFVISSHQQGKEIWQFDQEDWKNAGLNTAEGFAKGFVSGYAFYGLTNVANMSAPAAGAVVSGTFGLLEAVTMFRDGEIDADGFLSMVNGTMLDSAGAALGGIIGQTMIPIPILGPMLGSMMISSALKYGRELLNERERLLLMHQQNDINAYIITLDQAYQSQLMKYLTLYQQIDDLQEYMLDPQVNVRIKFETSQDLAELVGVESQKILRNKADIDAYFLS